MVKIDGVDFNFNDIQQAIEHCISPLNGGKSAILVGPPILGADMKLHIIYQCQDCKAVMLKEIELE